MNKIRFGIAGYGKMGKIRENTIYESEECELVSIFDISHCKHDDDNIILCDTYDELLKTDVDAVVVAAYVKVASDYVIRALNAGKHVFCEKPPSMNTEQMHKVIEVERRTGKVLKYGFNHRYHFSVMEAKKVIEKGELGKLLWMRGVYGKAGSIDFHDNWRNYKEYSGGGILLDQGIHMLDLFRYLSGFEFNILSSHFTTSYWDIEAEDNAFLLLEAPDGVVATLHSSATQWKHKFLLEMAFEDGYLNLDGILSSTRSYAPEKLISGMREFEDVTFAMGKPKETVTCFEYDRSWEFELNEFVNAVNGDTPVMNGTSRDSLQIMQIIDQVYRK